MGTRRYTGVQMPPAGSVDTFNRRGTNSPAPDCIAHIQSG